MCEAKPGRRCAADTCSTAASTAATYADAHPGGPAIGALEQTETELTAAHADVTLAGTSRVHDMQRHYQLREALTKPPVILPDDTTAQAVKKWAKYTAANGDLDPEGYAAARGWVPLSEEETDRLRERAGSVVSDSATAWDTTADPDGARATFLDTRPSAKEGTWASRWNREDTFAVVNLANRHAAASLTADLREFVAANGGNPDDIDGRLVERMLRMTGPEAAKDKMRAHLWAHAALGDTPIYGVRPPKPLSEYSRGTRDSGLEVLDNVIAKLGGAPDDDAYDVAAYQADKRAYEAALLRLVHDEDELRNAFGATDPSKDDEKTIHAPLTYPSEYSFNEVLASARALRRESTTRLAATQLVVERFGMADDLYLNQQRRTADHKHSATVWEDKKNIPATHVVAAQGSTFRRDGMGHVEIDESVDLDDFHKVEAEWAELSRRVPHTTAPARMAFRLTGRHQAAGVYSPDRDAIAVDPRHPSSMWHEYVHHLDHTSGGRQISLSDDFRPILRSAQQAVRDDERFAKMGKALDYWRTPTEVLSRSAELWLHWKGVNTSLNGDQHKYDGNPAYESLYPMREQIMRFFDTKFGEPNAR